MRSRAEPFRALSQRTPEKSPTRLVTRRLTPTAIALAKRCTNMSMNAMTWAHNGLTTPRGPGHFLNDSRGINGADDPTRTDDLLITRSRGARGGSVGCALGPADRGRGRRRAASWTAPACETAPRRHQSQGGGGPPDGSRRHPAPLFRSRRPFCFARVRAAENRLARARLERLIRPVAWAVSGGAREGRSRQPNKYATNLRPSTTANATRSPERRLQCANSNA